jgi:hypothetical protein
VRLNQVVKEPGAEHVCAPIFTTRGQVPATYKGTPVSG